MDLVDLLQEAIEVKDRSDRRGPSRPEPAASDALVALVRRMAARDEPALAAFYDATSSWVYGTVLRLLRQSDAAEEVVVDVYHEAWQRAAQYDTARATPIGWVLNIAKSRAIDRLRASAAWTKRAARLDGLEDAGASEAAAPDHRSALAERGALVRQALTELSQAQARPIEMAYFGGHSQSEIARELGLPLGTVKTRIRTGMRLLERKLRFLRGGA